MQEIYQQVQAQLKTLDFEKINPGFKAYPVALYNTSHYILDGEIQPITDQFIGNTAIILNNQYTAIWNLEEAPDIELPHLIDGLIHEMYHAHQLTFGQSNFPDDFKILAEASSMPYLGYLSLECDWLVESTAAISNEEKLSLLRNIFAARQARENLQPALFQQEMNLENFEGIVEFVGYCALEQISKPKAKQALDQYMNILVNKNNLTNMRYLSYSKSVLFLALLKSLELSFVNVDQTKQPNYYKQALQKWYKAIPAHAVNNKHLIAAEQIYNQALQKSRSKIDAFLAIKPTRIQESGRICGYDPCNMCKYEQQILCSHFIAIDFGTGPEFIQGPVLLRIEADDIKKVTEYWIQTK